MFLELKARPEMSFFCYFLKFSSLVLNFSTFHPLKGIPKIVYDQLYIYMNKFLNELLCGFRKVHSTQHALFKLLQAWQKELDNSGSSEL